jgi:hypothetical protein
MNVQAIDNILIMQIVGAGLVSVRGRTLVLPYILT